MNNIAIIALVFMTGLCWGVVFDDSMWSDKCKQGGMVTSDDVIYQCKAVKVEIKAEGQAR